MASADNKGLDDFLSKVDELGTKKTALIYFSHSHLPTLFFKVAITYSDPSHGL